MQKLIQYLKFGFARIFSFGSYPDLSWKKAVPIIERHMGSFRIKPVIAVAMPVFNPDPNYLKAAIESVQAQLYPLWELCIADFASTNSLIAQIPGKVRLSLELEKPTAQIYNFI